MNQRRLAGPTSYRDDLLFCFGEKEMSAWLLIRGMLSPSVVAARVFRRAAGGGVIVRHFSRWIGLALFASDIGPGAVFRGPMFVPHPSGIVIGRGAVIGENVTIYQNVTVGQSSSGRYPDIGANVTIYSGAVVFGSVRLDDGTTVPANAVVSNGRKSG